MRFYGLALTASALVLGACAGGENKASDSAAVAGDTTAMAAPATPAGTPSTTGAGSGSMAAITGKTHEVKMEFDGTNYKFVPENITVKAGDGIKWVMVSGGPHNVAFQNVPAAAKTQLMANMPSQMSELSSPMMMNAGENYTVSFTGVPAGKYEYVCTPHLAMNMRGTVTVQ
jgi:plastocyanin